MIDQTGEFARTQSARYVRDRQGFAPATIFPEDVEGITDVRSVLDVGCGHAVNLVWLVDSLDASSGVGVEPSPDAVELLSSQHADDDRLSFVAASAHALPFATDAFDLVVVWSVLHWIGRDEYLQSLGEALRVTARWLLVMDFDPIEAYRTPYRHVPGLHTYKQDFTVPLLASGQARLASRQRWWEPEPGMPRVPIASSERVPFRGNPLNWHARQVCLFEKDRELLDLREASDFTG